MRYFRRSADGGQSLVEFALVVPILVLLILGTFDLGYVVFLNNQLDNAAREGARTGIILANSDSTICARVTATAPTLDLSCSQITISPSPTRSYGQPITVTVNYNYQPLIPLVDHLSPGGFHLSSTSVMIVEGVSPN